MPEDLTTVTIENAQLIFRNFTGKEGRFNSEGERSFCILLDPDTAEQMHKDGWNVKGLVSREEDEPDTPYLQISVNYKNRPPRIVMITSNGRTTLDEAQVGVLDWADIEVADLIINPYQWDVNGKSGVKAYLKSLFVTIAEDELERKYGINDGN